jgi:hypothetical protein
MDSFKKSKSSNSSHTQFLFNNVKEKYDIFNKSIKIIDENDIIQAILIKNFISYDQFIILKNFILQDKHIPNHEKKYQINIDKSHQLYTLLETIFLLNSTVNGTIHNFNMLHIFNNYVVDTHRDSEEYTMKNLFILKHDDIDGLTVFPEYEMAFQLENTDLLLFNTNMLHYACTNKMVSKKYYRYALYFE